MEDGWHASQLGLQAAPLASAVAGLSTASPPPEVTMIPMATAGPCYTNCQMVMPFMVLLFFMTLVVAVTQVNHSEKNVGSERWGKTHIIKGAMIEDWSDDFN